jgi:hypothetical protein
MGGKKGSNELVVLVSEAVLGANESGFVKFCAHQSAVLRVMSKRTNR